MVRLTILLFLACLGASAEAATFLNLPNNPRRAAAGDMAHYAGVKGLLINPAAATQPAASAEDFWQLDANVAQIAEDLNYININGLLPRFLIGGRFAFGVQYFSVSNFTNYDSVGNDLGRAAIYDVAAYLTYAREVPWGVLVGVSPKVIQRHIHTFSATTQAVDLGAKKQLALGKGHVWASLALQNLGPAEKFDEGTSPLPWRATTSAAYSFAWLLPRHFGGYIGPQVRYEKDRGAAAAAGLELAYSLRSVTLALRGAYAGGQATETWSAGSGVTFDQGEVVVDAALGYLPYGDLGSGYTFSLKVARPLEAAMRETRELPEDYVHEVAGLAKARELKYFMDTAKEPPGSLESAIKGLREKYSIDADATNLIFIGERNALLYLGGDPAEQPHELTTREGSVLRGMVLAINDKVITIKTKHGTLKVFRAGVGGVIDKRLVRDPAKSP